MSHPYRMQLPGNSDEVNLKFPEKVKQSNNNYNSPPIRPHQLLAKHAPNSRKSHPYLQQLPTDLSKSMESLYMSSPRNHSFDSSIGRSPRGSSTSNSPVRSFQSVALHSSKPTNSIRALLTEDDCSSYYTSVKSSPSNNENGSSPEIVNAPSQSHPTVPQTIPKNEYEQKLELPGLDSHRSEPNSRDTTIDDYSNFTSVSNDADAYNNEEDDEDSVAVPPPTPVHAQVLTTATNYSQTLGIARNNSGYDIASNTNSTVNSKGEEEQKPMGLHKKQKSTLNLFHPVYNNVDNLTEIGVSKNDTTTYIGGNTGILGESANINLNTEKISASKSNVNLLPMGTSIEMYRQNAKKTKDPDILFSFAQILIRTSLSKRSDNPLSDKEKEKYLDEAFTALKKSSKSGCIEAQYYLGDAFSVGLFSKGKPELNKSLTYFESAAKARHAESAYRTAMCYKKGWGCTRDARKVVKYLEIAAINNHPVAMMEYGIYAFHGLMSFPEDVNTKKKGISWLRRATECATEMSCGAPYELALIYMNGFKDIVIKDTNYAIKLLFKASNLGHAKSATMLGKFYEIGDIVEANADLSIHFYNMSANLGDADGMMGLCSWYFVGSEHLPQDYDEAFAWAIRAAENYKHNKAMLLLERFYELGIGCEKDKQKSKYWGDLARKQEKKK
ncbi:hypothetical protein PMKS-003809 [Pichia membranifaciens]|uniref:Protein SKT5 n=1 Tax=Pichia membranifaciens TaxID=4926 RepID=A0A1Q2YL97_9ASCO|nr:hypothetical protein PMKS-003809 [Pichia membranifaciens]